MMHVDVLSWHDCMPKQNRMTACTKMWHTLILILHVLRLTQSMEDVLPELQALIANLPPDTLTWRLNVAAEAVK